jgi:hypothetical protein
MMYPPVAWSVRAQGRERRRLLRGRGWVQALGSGRGGDRRPRSMLSLSPRVGRGGVHHPRSRLSPSPRVGRGGDHRPRSRLSPSPRVGRGGASYGAWGQTWRLSASPWQVAQQSEQRRRRCFPVRSASGGAKWLRSLRLYRLKSARQDKVSGDPCIECSCDPVGWRGDLGQGCFSPKPARAGPRASRRCARCLRRPSGEVWIWLGLLFLLEAGLGRGEIMSLERTELWPELRPSGLCIFVLMGVTGWD